MSLFWPGDRTPGEITTPAELSVAGGLVGERFDAASDYAASLWSIAESLLTNLGNVDYPIDWDAIDLEPVDPGGLGGISASEPPAPSITPIVVSPVTLEGEPPDPVTIDLPTRVSPTPNITDPDFSIPDPPDVTWPIFSAEPPDVSDPEIPGVPTIDLPPAPQLPEISIPSPPEYSIPDFDWELPTDDLTPPDPQFVWNEAEYDSAVRQALSNKLLNKLFNEDTGLVQYSSNVEDALINKLYAELVEFTQFPEYDSEVKQRLIYNLLRDLINGFTKGEYYSDINQKLADELYNELVVRGTGLPEATEQGIYDRAVSRQLDEEQTALEQTLEFFASRLYELPPGALSNQMLEMNNKVLKTREDLNRDILIQQSNLAQVNTHFMFTKSIDREKHLLDQDDRYNKDVITKTHFVTSAGIQQETALMTYDIQHTKNFIDYVHSMISAAVQNEKNLMDNKVQYDQLYLGHIEFVITSAVQWEKVLMDYSNDFQNRALDAAKFAVQGALLIYQVKVEAYKARLAAYTAQAEVYKARVAGEIAKAEFYKAQMEGIKASAEVQKAIADIYASQVNAARIYVELYKAEMEGAAIRAQVDEVRIRGFAALVQAYSAQVTAASERYRGYESQIKGEVAKADLYKSQVQGYAAMVEAYKSEVQADTMVLAQEIEANKNKIDIFKAQLQKYLADVQYAIADAEVQSKAEGLKIDVFKALATNYGVELDALIKVYASKVEHAKAQADVEIKEADIIVREALGKYELLLKSITAAAQVASQMAAAAISGVSASANIQHGESRSDSRSASVNESYIAQDIKSQSVSWQNIWTHED
jgi:hypothetical protein